MKTQLKDIQKTLKEQTKQCLQHITNYFGFSVQKETASMISQLLTHFSHYPEITELLPTLILYIANKKTLDPVPVSYYRIYEIFNKCNESQLNRMLAFF